MHRTEMNNAASAALQRGVTTIGASGLLAGAPLGASPGAGFKSGGNGANNSNATMPQSYLSRAMAAVVPGTVRNTEHGTTGNIYAAHGFATMADEMARTRSSASAVNPNTAATRDYNADIRTAKEIIQIDDETEEEVMLRQQQQQKLLQRERQQLLKEQHEQQQQLLHKQQLLLHQQQQQLLQQQQQRQQQRQQLLQQHQLQHLPRATSPSTPSPTNFYNPIETSSSSARTLVINRKRKAPAATPSKQSPHQLQLLQALRYSSNAQANLKRDLVLSSASGVSTSGSAQSNNINIGGENSTNKNNVTGTTTTSSLTNYVASTSKNSSDSTNENSVPTDVHSVYGTFVGMSIAKLNTNIAKIITKRLVFEILFDAEMGKYDDGIPTQLH